MAREAFVRIIVACIKSLGDGNRRFLVVDRYGRSCGCFVESDIQIVRAAYEEGGVSCGWLLPQMTDARGRIRTKTALMALSQWPDRAAMSGAIIGDRHAKICFP